MEERFDGGEQSCQGDWVQNQMLMMSTDIVVYCYL